ALYQTIAGAGFTIDWNTCLLQSLYVAINCPLTNVELFGKILCSHDRFCLQLKINGNDSIKSLGDVHVVKVNILKRKNANPRLAFFRFMISILSRTISSPYTGYLLYLKSDCFFQPSSLLLAHIFPVGASPGF